MIDWNLYPNFTENEFRCRGTDCCGGLATMNADLLRLLQSGRTLLGFALPVTSGYRCPVHNARVSSTGDAGPHTTGQAVDIGVDRGRAFQLLAWVMSEKAFTGIGLDQRGAGRFIHLDTLVEPGHAPRPTVWTYP